MVRERKFKDHRVSRPEAFEASPPDLFPDGDPQVLPSDCEPVIYQATLIGAVREYVLQSLTRGGAFSGLARQPRRRELVVVFDERTGDLGVYPRREDGLPKRLIENPRPHAQDFPEFPLDTEGLALVLDHPISGASQGLETALHQKATSAHWG
ncbi:hypothetical protein COY59_05620 [Candidatus Gottesmanbacteria bacterium CG_4_10_14_0_8_um_filter_37_24]|uniref:Uncharacterized protein n=1 Tax=Candidatus Gottesmanbacteria bacterium CG_4_10_14_0_8_um_filter_37_24 TaxID=1974574 RepID=A0A2M7RPM0_9BACT|nr:MAG: hypothetical protein COX23_03230 [Candidatus Gottesmanbacteria bacterium CG23_combo_of_CG06-09_8_20_14_all_37_19]PIZ02278.1 MAG: hypothetical protein COY59_05620 [Candidatus Gottesmanbacteria bacterium CG_4_10_14_0_8_um_filter_37_24]